MDTSRRDTACVSSDSRGGGTVMGECGGSVGNGQVSIQADPWEFNLNLRTHQRWTYPSSFFSLMAAEPSSRHWPEQTFCLLPRLAWITFKSTMLPPSNWWEVCLIGQSRNILPHFGVWAWWGRTVFGWEGWDCESWWWEPIFCDGCWVNVPVALIFAVSSATVWRQGETAAPPFPSTWGSQASHPALQAVSNPPQ